MHIILTGATGLVGSGVLHTILNTPSITKLSILSRRPLPQLEATNPTSSKVTVIIHKDFGAPYPSDVLDKLKGAEGCIWALGVSSNGLDVETYKKITHDYTILAARSFSPLSHPKPFKFIYVSGEGATQSPSLFTPMFGTIKGQTESSLMKLSSSEPAACENLRVINVRPAVVDPSSHEEIKDWIPRRAWMLRLADTLVPIVRLNGNWVSPTRDLGRVCVDLVMQDGEKMDKEGVILGNAELRKLGGW